MWALWVQCGNISWQTRESRCFLCVSSVQFSRSVMSDSLRPYELQYTRPPCPSPTPGVYPISCPMSRWCHPTISSSVILLSSCPQSFSASGSFQMNQLFVIRWPKYWSLSFNISPSNEHPGLISFRMDWCVSSESLLWVFLVAQMINNPPAMQNPGFDPWVGKIPWRRRAWQLTLVFLPGESLWTEEPSRLQFMGSQRVGYDDWVTKHTHTHTHTHTQPIFIASRQRKFLLGG